MHVINKYSRQVDCCRDHVPPPAAHTNWLSPVWRGPARHPALVPLKQKPQSPHAASGDWMHREQSLERRAQRDETVAMSVCERFVVR